MNALAGKRILLGVSGGIAIYKALSLLSALNKKGAKTTVVMSKGAQEFVRPLAFQTMSKNRVYTDTFDMEENGFIPHIDLTREHDVLLIAPASADTLAKMAHGISDDLLSTTALAAHCPVIVSPAMNSVMYHHPATQRNIQQLAQDGVEVIEPGDGLLACNEIGEGRMPEAEELLDVLDSFFTKKDLQGKKILVTAGPTRERIDPVRFLTNDSSGKQGIAIARRAFKRGAQVCLVHGPMSQPAPKGIEGVSVESTEDMLHALEEKFPTYDALIMAAAPCDFRPVRQELHKIKGTKSGARRNLELAETTDILYSLLPLKINQIVIGFATESENLLKNAREKMDRKKLDYIVANDVTQSGAAFNVDTNIVTILGNSREETLPKMSKEDVADRILDLLL